MRLKCHTRIKDGKEHRYWSIVESLRCGRARVVQRHILYLGELNEAQRNGFRPGRREQKALADAYRAEITWEPPESLEARAARLLPGLLLARVDGKSPVEYITTEAPRATVRRTARALLADPVDRLQDVRHAWEEELRR